MLDDLGIDDVIVATGFHQEKIKKVVGTRARCVYYPGFAETNNLYTLAHCKRYLDRPTIVMVADLLLERAALDGLFPVRSDYELLIDTSKNLSGTMRVRFENGILKDMGQHVSPDDGHGNYIGLMAMSERGALLLGQELEAMVQEEGFVDDYYTRALPRLVEKGAEVTVRSVAGLRWFEVDTIADYVRAMFEIKHINNRSVNHSK